MIPLKSYEHGLLTNIINPMREEEIKEKFSIFGNVEKIKHTSRYRIYDFIIRKNKLLIEVTSTNMIFPYSKALPEQRIRKALNHIKIKNVYKLKNNCLDFRTIGIIFVDIVHAGIMGFFRGDYSSLMSLYNIDCIILMPDNASMNGESSRLKYPRKIFFSKDSKITEDERKLIEELFQNS